MPLRPSTRTVPERRLPLARPCVRSAETAKASETSLARGPDNSYANIHLQKQCEFAPAKCSCTGCCSPDSLEPRTRSSRELRLCSSNRQTARPIQLSPRWRPCSKSLRRRLPSSCGSHRTCSYKSPSRSPRKYDRSQLPSWSQVFQSAKSRRYSPEYGRALRWPISQTAVSRSFERRRRIDTKSRARRPLQSAARPLRPPAHQCPPTGPPRLLAQTVARSLARCRSRLRSPLPPFRSVAKLSRLP